MGAKRLVGEEISLVPLLPIKLVLQAVEKLRVDVSEKKRKRRGKIKR